MLSYYIWKLFTGRKISQLHKDRISRGMKGHYLPKGEKSWISKAFLITFPDGHMEKVKGLFGFCRGRGLVYDRLRYAQKKGGKSSDGFDVRLVE